MPSPTLGVIYGNRDFFPDELVTESRADIAALFDRLGINTIQLGESDSKLGGVETYADARKCADLFARHRKELDGVLVVLPNFGDEKGVADVLKLAQVGRSRIGSGVPGRPWPIESGAAARWVLRKNIRLQQPQASWNQILADEETRRATR